MKYAEAKKMAQRNIALLVGDFSPKEMAANTEELRRTRMARIILGKHCINNFDKALKALHVVLLFLNKHSPARATILRGIIKELEEVEGV